MVKRKWKKQWYTYAIEKSGTHEIHISKAVRRQCQWDKEQRQVAR